MHDGKNLLNITIVYDKGYSCSFSFLKTGFQSGQVENRDPGLRCPKAVIYGTNLKLLLPVVSEDRVFHAKLFPQNFRVLICSAGHI